MADLSEQYSAPGLVLPDEQFESLMAEWQSARTSRDHIALMISTLGLVAETAATVHNPALGAAVRGLRTQFEDRFERWDLKGIDTADLAGQIQNILGLMKERK